MLLLLLLRSPMEWRRCTRMRYFQCSWSASHSAADTSTTQQFGLGRMEGSLPKGRDKAALSRAKGGLPEDEAAATLVSNDGTGSMRGTVSGRSRKDRLALSGVKSTSLLSPSRAEVGVISSDATVSRIRCGVGGKRVFRVVVVAVLGRRVGVLGGGANFHLFVVIGCACVGVCEVLLLLLLLLRVEE